MWGWQGFWWVGLEVVVFVGVAGGGRTNVTRLLRFGGGFGVDRGWLSRCGVKVLHFCPGFPGLAVWAYGWFTVGLCGVYTTPIFFYSSLPPTLRR